MELAILMLTAGSAVVEIKCGSIYRLEMCIRDRATVTPARIFGINGVSLLFKHRKIAGISVFSRAARCFRRCV